MADEGLYVSTAGEYFHDKDSLQEHYKSAFHRYNLKRKIAGLPPVTREWYEARKAQLAAAAAQPAARVWTDPLTKKRFFSENTYLAYVRSRRYKDLVKASGAPAPAPLVAIRRERAEDEEPERERAAPQAPFAAPAGFVTKGGMQAVEETARRAAENAKRRQEEQGEGEEEEEEERGGRGSREGGRGSREGGRRSFAMGLKSGKKKKEEEEEEEDEEDEDSEWETASEEDYEAAEEEEEEAEEEEEGEECEGSEDGDVGDGIAGVDWDVRRSLFDEHVSESLEANLVYMHKTYGFYLPDAEYLVDPEGLIKYLGAKLAAGHIPLYVSGLDPDAKRFRSLHAVRRHMIDRVNCKMLYDDNEEEYEDYYDYGDEDDDEDEEDGGAAEGAAPSSAAASRARPAPSALITALDAAASASAGGSAAAAYELTIPRADGRGTLTLGTREFARYYKQRQRLGETHEGASAARVLREYRRLAIECAPSQDVLEKRRADRAVRKERARWIDVALRRNINDKLPKNVPY